ncbi:MAG: hypothetical protein KatS3mg060_1172 [Dehalococcoidia bacterium]|nr:MAG: hypothetical protein KatS3mg060_1172 [Dehalococcoidia bacterium]
MPNPRDTISFVGIGAEYVTFRIDNATITYDATQPGGSAVVGRAVGLSAAGTVELVANGDEVLGKLIAVEPNLTATVQTGGYCTLPGGQGASLTLGKRIVGALGPGNARGYIREVNTSVAAELGVARGLIVDASTASATVVRL